MTHPKHAADWLIAGTLVIALAFAAYVLIDGLWYLGDAT